MEAVKCDHCGRVVASEIAGEWIEVRVLGAYSRLGEPERRHFDTERCLAAWYTARVVKREGGEIGTASNGLSPSEAVYAFAGWLTSSPTLVKMRSHHNAAPIAVLVDQFCKRNELAEPREGWEKNIRPVR